MVIGFLFLNGHCELLFYFATFCYSQGSELGACRLQIPFSVLVLFFSPLFFPFFLSPSAHLTAALSWPGSLAKIAAAIWSSHWEPLGDFLSLRMSAWICSPLLAAPSFSSPFAVHYSARWLGCLIAGMKIVHQKCSARPPRLAHYPDPHQGLPATDLCCENHQDALQLYLDSELSVFSFKRYWENKIQTSHYFSIKVIFFISFPTHFLCVFSDVWWIPLFPEKQTKPCFPSIMVIPATCN